VPRAKPAERALPSLGDEIGQHHYDASMPEYPAGIRQAGAEIGASARRLKGDQVPDNPQCVPPAFPWRDHPLYGVREEQGSDAIVVMGGGKRQHRRDLNGASRLGHRFTKSG
jgi:hypothetical protein